MIGPIYTIIYASTAVRSFSVKELEFLLNAARAKNLKLGITGLLVYADDTFFQVLEGEEGVVEKLYAQIVADSRHYNIIKLANFTFGERRYKEWTMKYRKIETGVC